jgi:hypothetical protein
MKDRNALNDKQSGLNMLGGAFSSMQNDPNRLAAQNLTANILANPDPTDWEQIKNLETASRSNDLKTGLAQISSSANRRGIGPAAMTGFAGNLERLAANDKATALGQLDVQQSEKLRQAQYAAMQPCS